MWFDFSCYLAKILNDTHTGDDGRRSSGSSRPKKQRSTSSSSWSTKYAAGFDDDEGSDTIEDEIEDRLYQRYRNKRNAERRKGRDGDTSVEDEMRRLRGL